MKNMFRKTTALFLTFCMIVGMTGLPITAYAEGLDSGDSDAAIVAADKDALTVGFAGSDSAGGVTGNLILVTTGASGSSIAWLSDTPEAIDHDGMVTRPDADAEDAEVTLTATITYGEAEDTREFTVTVLKELAATVTDDAAIVPADKAALEIGFSVTDSVYGVTADLMLPVTGVSGSAITWLSDTPEVIASDGMVTRPDADAEDAEVTLTATITHGEASDTKEFTVTVLKAQAELSDSEIVAADKDALAIGFADGDSADNVTASLTLPLTGTSGSTITWQSGNPDVIANDGTVIRPEADTEDVEVTLTATITCGEASDTKEFTVTVLKDGGLQMLMGPMSTVVWEGDGLSEATAFQVSSAEHLADIPNQGLGAHYIQTANIDLAEAGYTNWTPIGDHINQFTGTYDGGGYTISNLTINTTLDLTGLFGFNSGTLSNITLEDVSVFSSTSGGRIGALAGSNSGTGNIDGCSSNGSVSGGWADIGGLVGTNNGTIEDSGSSAAVSGGSGAKAGGITGGNNGTIFRSTSSGAVTGADNASVGGLVGLMMMPGAVIDGCHSTGNVTGGANAYVGGLVGYQMGGTILNSSSSGNITGGTDAMIGSLVGTGMMPIALSGIEITSTGHKTEYTVGEPLDITGLVVTGSYDGDNTAVLPITTAHITGFDSSAAATGQELTITYSGKAVTYTIDVCMPDWVGEGTSTNPYQVSSPQHLMAIFAKGLTAHYIQTANIDLTGINWTPIGDSSSNSFTGTYDGGGFDISNLTINSDTLEFVGLFGYVDSGGTLKDITLENVDIHSSGDYAAVGGLIGYCGEGASVTDCGVSGNIAATAGTFTHIGGLAGTNEGTIANSASSASVSAGSGEGMAAGGLVGGSSGSITGCTSSGPVSAGFCTNVGGLVGTFKMGEISDSHSTGSVTGNGIGGGAGTWLEIGGLVGNVNVMRDCAIFNCYSTSDVVGSGDYRVNMGGLIGSIEGMEPLAVSNSYSTGDVVGSAPELRAGGFAGMIDGYNHTITNCYSTGGVTNNSPSGGHVGGFIGRIPGNEITIANCYSTGVATSAGENVGGFIGSTYTATLTVASCYFPDTMDAGPSGKGTALSATALKQQDSFEGWNFNTIWKIGQNISYPSLQWQTWTNDEEITADLIALAWTDIQGTNSAENDVTSALVLITSGARGTAITWSADPTGYINTSSGALSKPYTDEVAVTLTATVSKGSGTPQTKTFDLTVKPMTPDEAIAFDKDALTWAVIKGTNSVEDNVTTALVLPSAGTSGTTEITWSVDPTGNIDTANGTVTRPSRSQGDKTVTLTATISRDDGGTPQTVDFTLVIKAESGGSGGGSSGGGSSGGSSVTVPPEKKPDQPLVTSAELTPTVDKNGLASASVPDQAIKDAIAKAQEEAKKQGKTANGIGVSLDMKMPEGASSLSLTLSQAALQSLVNGNVQSLEIGGGIASLNLNLEALKEIQKQSTGSVTITIKPVKNLSAAAKKLIGARPVYDVTISYVKDGKTVTITSLGKGSATLSFPYTPGKNEAIGWLFGVYVDGKGNATRIPGSAYDANSGSVILSGNHFSIYGVGYTAPTEKYTDIATHWAKESIDYVVGRGLFSGTTDINFSPNTAMDRGMLVTVLGRLAGADVSAYKTSSFSDVAAGKYYLPYVEWAYKKGIISGIGNDKFAPERAVTREEIALILQNYAKATGYTLPVTREAITFADNSSIASAYANAIRAMQQAGIMVGGSGNKFNPKAGATRAEVAAMLHRYVKLTIDPATAQGWTLNDDGRYMYYKDGKPVTGWQTIDGVKYYFYSTGILQTGWVKDGNNWRYYSGNKALTGRWDIGSETSKKRYYFDTNAVMVSGKWLQIEGKWYYFYADGSLARGTKIDGYEVDENGVRKTE